jgi:hypothetical protein
MMAHTKYGLKKRLKAGLTAQYRHNLCLVGHFGREENYRQKVDQRRAAGSV